MRRDDSKPLSRALAAALIAAAMCASAEDARATTIALGSIQDLTDRSDAVVRATVVDGSSLSQWDAEHRFIVTRTRLRVVESLDGVLPPGTEITVESPGGFIAEEDIGLIIPGAPDYDDGQEVVAFLVLGADNMLRTLDLSAGKFEVNRENGEEILTRKDLGGDGVILLEEPGSPAPMDAPARRGVVAPGTTLTELKAKVTEAAATKDQRRPIAALEANGGKAPGLTLQQIAAEAARKKADAINDAVRKGLIHQPVEGVRP